MEKQMLISLLKKEDLNMREIDVWSYVIKWGIGQTENLEGKKFSVWNENDFGELKNILKDIIPLIRFRDISDKCFYNKIMPYKMIFPRVLWKNISNYYKSYRKVITS